MHVAWMRPIATHVVTWSVCMSVTGMNLAKTAEPTEMPFGVWTSVGPNNHVLDGGPEPPGEAEILRVGKYMHARACPRSV